MMLFAIDKRAGQRGGAMLILLALLMPVLTLMAAMAVDVAWMQLVRTELRSATDSAARAGAKTLSLEQDFDLARAAAVAAARSNDVAGEGLVLGREDVDFGSSVQRVRTGPFVFTPGASPPNGVRAVGRRTRSALGGSVPLFFAGVTGVPDFQPQEQATATILDRDICLVVDRSLSMLGPKMEGLKFALGAFLDEVVLTYPVEQIALVSYSSSSTIDEPLTVNYEVVRDKANAMVPFGFTAIGSGLQDGLTTVLGPKHRPFAFPTIILLTDGVQNTGPAPEGIATAAAQRGVVIHAISFGPDADRIRMQRIATIGRGEYFHADDTRDLKSVFEAIARTLPVLLTE